MAPMEPEPIEIGRKPHESGNVVTILVYTGATGHHFHETVISDLKHRLQDYASKSTPRTILTAGGALLDDTAEGVLQGLITDDYGEQHLARIAIVTVPGNDRNLFSEKTAATKVIVSSFDANKLRLEAGEITVPLRGEKDDLYSFKLDFSANGYAGKELAMNAVANAQVWHRRLGHLNKHRLGLMNRKSGNGVAFDGSIADCDVCTVEKSHQLVHPNNANHVAINSPFQLMYGDLMGPFKPTGHGGYKFVSKITDQFTTWTAVYLLCPQQRSSSCLASAVRHFNNDASWQAHHQMACRQWRRIYGRRVQGLLSRTGITQEFAATNTPQQIAVSERVGRTSCGMVRCMLVDSGLPPFL